MTSQFPRPVTYSIYADEKGRVLLGPVYHNSRIMCDSARVQDSKDEIVEIYGHVGTT